MKTKILIPVFLLFSISLFAQKQSLNHDVYDSWNDIKSYKMSNNGDYSAYQLNPQKGDGELFLINHESINEVHSFKRGQSHAFSANSKFLIFKVGTQADSIRNLKIAKTKDDEYPKDSLFIYSINDNKLTEISRVKSFQVAKEDLDILCYLHEKEEKVEEVVDSTVVEEVVSDTLKVEEVELEGTKLVLWDLGKDKQAEYENVSEYLLSENGSLLVYRSEFKDSIDSTGIYITNPNSFEIKEILLFPGYSKGLSVDKHGERFAFYYSSDTAEIKIWTVKIFEMKYMELRDLNADDVINIPNDWTISENYKLAFTEDGDKLYFGTSFVIPELDLDSIPDDEIATLDIWSWNDGRIQPDQLHNLKKDKTKTFASVFNFSNNKAVQIADSSMDYVRLVTKGQNTLTLGYSSIPYEHTIQWTMESYRDYFIVNANTGDRTKIADNFSGSVSLAPGARFAAVYDKRDSTWYMYDVFQKISYPMTDDVDVNFYNEDHQVPLMPSHWGMAGWLKNDRAAIVYDKYDLWLLTSGKDGEVKNLTNSYGRDNNVVLRYVRTDRDKFYIDENENILIKGLNKETKNSSLYLLNIKTGKLDKIIDVEYRIGGISKAKDKEIYSYSKSDFTTYPDRYLVNDIQDWNNAELISDANPQMDDYLWGSVEQYQWTDFNGNTVDGLLYKPEGFDALKEYPMIVYFYEKYSDGLHSHYTPRPSRSVINFPLYTSNGYLIFIPDIHYVTGQPGKDAYNSIVSGTYSLIEKGFVNKDKIGLQGQSWGGYQVAYLVTQTDLYTCAMAGAPVSNMTSAYGGIRYGSGHSRMMQYEEGQSRIGGTLWEELPKYIENSPVFFADRINTPLLIMHNDGDGAVPFTQGVELFVAMKRLNKPAWLLNYNGDEHNLMQRANCVDLSHRMLDFFDYYLMDQERPEWLENGVPALYKGQR